jgi:hypothetical protein
MRHRKLIQLDEQKILADAKAANHDLMERVSKLTF